VGGGEDVFRVGRKLHVLAVEVETGFGGGGVERESFGANNDTRYVPDGIVTLCEGLETLSGW
jgi:hypothetical protein